jgi:telomere length regulation protein
MDAYLVKDQFVRSMLSSIIGHGSATVFSSFFGKMKAFEQQKYLNSVIASLSKQYLNIAVETREESLAASSSPVAAVASFINELIEHNDAMKDHLVMALVRSALPSLEDSIAVRRSVIAVLAKDEGQTMK